MVISLNESVTWSSSQGGALPDTSSTFRLASPRSKSAEQPSWGRPTLRSPGLTRSAYSSRRTTIVLTEDVTDAFRTTCAALAAARKDLEDELRKKNAMLQGIDEGILRRSLIVATK